MDVEASVEPDLWALYELMYRSRLFEEAVSELWAEGLISGEMHLGTGEEAVVAGMLAHLQDGDALALDHRGTAPMLMRGVDPVLLLKEFLGDPGGLCGGRGGHMHLFSAHHLAASSGIVGASGPAAVGFALAGQRLRPGSVALAFFGEGAINQGMLMESLNLAVVWGLPVIFVCKDDRWSITTPSATVTGQGLLARARGFGLPAAEVNGLDVEAVWAVADKAFQRARNGGGPSFIRADCLHLEGHMLGIQLVRLTRRPFNELPSVAGGLLRSMLQPKGVPFRERIRSLEIIMATLGKTFKAQRISRQDPLTGVRSKLKNEQQARLLALEADVQLEVEAVVKSALTPGDGGAR